MNDSLELRNRILKMRKSNNLVLDQVNSDSKTTHIYSEIIPEKTQNDLNSKEDNLKTKLEKEDTPIESKKIESTNFLKRKSVKTRVSDDVNSSEQTLDNLVYNNEAQFRILAKKFNEAVEVILELSDKVKNLEEKVHYLSVKSSKNKKSNSFYFYFKTFIFIIFTTLILLSLFTLPIDATLIKLIITDVISSI